MHRNGGSLPRETEIQHNDQGPDAIKQGRALARMNAVAINSTPIKMRLLYVKNRIGLGADALLFYSLVAVFLVAYFPIYRQLVNAWLEDSNNSHGLLVPFIATYIAWTIRHKADSVDPNSSRLGLFLLLVSLSIYLIGIIGGIVFFPRLSFVITLIALILYNYGWQMVRVFLFPLLFLFFMIPIPETLLGLVSYPLQLIVSDFSAGIISFLGIPVFQEGNLLHFAKYSFEVTEACSGIRSLVALIALASCLSYMIAQSYWARFILLVSSIPLATLGNLIRVVVTGLVAHIYGNWAAQGFLHDLSGILVFGFGVIGLVGEVLLLKDLPILR